MVSPLSSGAKADAASITRHYASEAGSAVARQFVAALRAARLHVAQYPESGSLRFASATGLEVLAPEGVSLSAILRDSQQGPLVLAILHSARDIPATLRP